MPSLEDELRSEIRCGCYADGAEAHHCLMSCQHTVTQGRPGPDRGSWCVACGEKVWAVHDRPCGECRHFKELDAAYHSCARHHMRITASMHVTYRVGNDAGDRGLCFEAKD